MTSAGKPRSKAKAGEPHDSWRRLDSRRAAWAAGLSLLAHVLGVFTLSAVAARPQIDISFELPAEVEFGMTDGMSADSAQGPLSQPEAAPMPNAGGDGVEGAGMDAGTPHDAGQPHDAGRRRRHHDAGAPDDAGRPGDASAHAAGDAAMADAGRRDAGAATGDGGQGRDGGPGGPGGADGAGRIPPGAQLAIRLNMERIRQSPLAPEVRRLLVAIPDWHALLDGSGIDPMADLDRLLLASPNLQRERLVLAGRHHRDQAYAEAAAERLAASQHTTTAFHARDGVRVAPWRNPDSTARVVALLGDHHFIICRPEDLPRVLALMHVRAEDQRLDAGVPAMAAADALLAMGDDEVMSFEIEGARRFVRAGRVDAMPLSGRLSVRETAGDTVQLAGQARFEDAAQARGAKEFWAAQLAQLARSPMVSLVGLSTPLRRLTLRVEAEQVYFETSLGAGQVRLLLGYLEGMLVQYRRDREPRNQGTPGPNTRAPTAPPAHPDAGAGG